MHRKKKKTDTGPNLVEELVFDGSDAQYHADAVRSLFSDVPSGERVIPLDDVTISKHESTGNAFNGNQTTPETETTGGEGEADGLLPSEQLQPTDGPLAHTEPSVLPADLDIVSDQRRSDDSLDLTDTENAFNGSQKSTKSKQSQPPHNASDDVTNKIPYKDIVYDNHDGEFTKRFEEEDLKTKFRSDCEKSGEVSVRPLRLTPIGQEQDSTEFDTKFRKYAKKHDVTLHYLQTNPKEKYYRVKGKRIISKSWSRYEHYKNADTYSEFMALSIAGKPKDQSLKKAKTIALADFKWDYERGFIVFPGHESRLPGHIFDSKQLATGISAPLSK